MVKYFVEKEKSDSKFFSIVATENDRIIKRSESVFSNEGQARELAEECNRGELEPIHLENIIEDYFALFD